MVFHVKHLDAGGDAGREARASTDIGSVPRETARHWRRERLANGGVGDCVAVSMGAGFLTLGRVRLLDGASQSGRLACSTSVRRQGQTKPDPPRAS